MTDTKVPIELSSTPGIVDNSTATAITIDSAGAATFSGDIDAGTRVSSSSAGGTRFDLTSADTECSLIANYFTTAVPLVFYTSALERMRLDASGQLGLGIVPSATTAFTVFQNKYLSLYGYDAAQSHIVTNTYYPVDNGVYKRQASGYAQKLTMVNGSYIFNTAASGAADSDITFSPAMTLDASGNLLVGTSAATGAAAASQIYGYSSSSTQNLIHFHLASALGPCVYFKVVGSSSWSGADSAMFLARDSITARSINAAGTVNASGADYAEYEQNNGLTISKGSVVGFKADGTLTLTFSEAVRFAIKSTDPAYVGGDSWGTKDAIGPEPTAPDEDAEQSVIDQYEDDLTTYKAVLEAARQLVDRIAYSGKVPVNIQGATAGDYIIAVAADDGSIDGQAVSDPDFTQYKLSVGRVNRILEDGRAEVAVIIH